jgi:hypothetical protein
MDEMLWLVDGETLTDSKLLALAIWLGLMDSPGGLQQPSGMPSEPISPVRGRQLVALRACLLYPQGMRHRAYPSAMPALEKLELVVSRPALGPGRKVRAWFITREGRDHLAEIDASKPWVATRPASDR